MPKSASGIHIRVYKYPRALYTNLTHSFKYLHAMLYIEENMRTTTTKESKLAKIELMLAQSLGAYDVPSNNATRLDIIHRIMDEKS